MHKGVRLGCVFASALVRTLADTMVFLALLSYYRHVILVMKMGERTVGATERRALPTVQQS